MLSLPSQYWLIAPSTCSNRSSLLVLPLSRYLLSKVDLLTQIFPSKRPDLSTPVIEITTNDSSLLDPGYILITPFTPTGASNLAAGSTTAGFTSLTQLLDQLADSIPNGPYIFDNEGVMSPALVL